MKTRLKRLAYLGVLGAVIAICSEQPSCATPIPALSPVAAEWKLASSPVCSRPVPAELRIWGGTTQARRACRAEYGGAPPMSLTIYYMPGWSGATAFDAFQRWQIQPGKMAFYKGHYFGVVESPQADRNALNRFTVAVESTLPGGADFHW
jgi:hypothetical protein